MTTYAYIRVSTDQQNCANQRFEIDTFAAKNHLKIDEYVEETISSRKPLQQRKLGRLLDKLNAGDAVIGTEISRLGRNMLEIMIILQQCLEKGCEIITIKENYHLKADIQSKVLAFAFGMAAEIERTLIAQRTKEALKLRKSRGMKLGRQAGSKNKNYKLDDKKNLILKYIKKGIPQRDMAKKLNVSVPTLSKFIRKNNEEFKS